MEARTEAIQEGPGFLRRAGKRLHDALPSYNVVLFGSFAWGIVMAASAALSFWIDNGLLLANPLGLIAVYFYGGSLAFAPGLWLAVLLSGRSGAGSRFVCATVVILLATHTMTAGIFALQYRVFYAHWHAAFPSIVWFFQLGFTSAGAVFTFTVSSLHYYWPFSCLAFAGFGLWFALRGRTKAH